MRKIRLPLVKEFFRSVRKGDFLPTRTRKKKRIERYLRYSNMFMLLAIDKKRAVGYLAYKINGKNGGSLGIGVIHGLRRRGIGRKLKIKAMKHMIDLGVKRITSKTWETNKKSQGLLKSLGYKKYREIKNDRINGESTYWYRYDMMLV